MTVGEFVEALAGYRWRQERQHEREAWLVHHLLIPHFKKGRAPSIEDLLGRPLPGPKRTRVQNWDEVERVLSGVDPEIEQRRQELEAMRAARARTPPPLPTPAPDDAPSPGGAPRGRVVT